MNVFFKGKPVNDDTGYISSLIHSSSIIPDGEYTISDTIVIDSGAHVQLSQNAVIRLADGASCLMLKNRQCGKDGAPDTNIVIEGGTWDGNNEYQKRGTPNPDKPFFMGVTIRIDNAENLVIKNAIFKDPEAYSVQLRRVTKFTVRDIFFDHNMLRPNMDGIHINGPASDGFIQNMNGATNDDLVALNCDDGFDNGEKCVVTSGPISNIVIDGIFAEAGYTAVRLLSCGSPLKNVTIKNVFGTFRVSGIALTHHSIIPGAPSFMDNIVIEDIFISKYPFNPPENKLLMTSLDDAYGEGCYNYNIRCEGIIRVFPGVHCGNMTIRSVHRDEYADTAAPLILVDETSSVKRLFIEDVTQVFHNAKPIPAITIKGDVEKLITFGTDE